MLEIDTKDEITPTLFSSGEGRQKQDKHIDKEENFWQAKYYG